MIYMLAIVNYLIAFRNVQPALSSYTYEPTIPPPPPDHLSVVTGRHSGTLPTIRSTGIGNDVIMLRELLVFMCVRVLGR